MAESDTAYYTYYQGLPEILAGAGAHRPISHCGGGYQHGQHSEQSATPPGTALEWAQAATAAVAGVLGSHVSPI